MKFTLTDTGAANLTNAFRSVLQVPINAALKNKELEYKKSNDQFTNRLRSAQTDKAAAETAAAEQMNAARKAGLAAVQSDDWNPDDTTALSRLAALTALASKDGKGLTPYTESKRVTGATINNLTGAFRGTGADNLSALSADLRGQDTAYARAALANLISGKGGLPRLARGDSGVAYDQYDGGGSVYDDAGHRAYISKTSAEAARARDQGAAARRTAEAAMIRANRDQSGAGAVPGGKNSTVTFVHVGKDQGVRQTRWGPGFQTGVSKGEKVVSSSGMGAYFKKDESKVDLFTGEKTTRTVTDQRAVEAANLWFAKAGLPATPRNVALYKEHLEAGDLFDFAQESMGEPATSPEPPAPANGVSRALAGIAPPAASAPPASASGPAMAASAPAAPVPAVAPATGAGLLDPGAVDRLSKMISGGRPSADDMLDATGRELGRQLTRQDLIKLVSQGVLSADDAMGYAQTRGIK